MHICIRLLSGFILAMAGVLGAENDPAVPEEIRLANEYFDIRFDGTTGGITALRHSRDKSNTDFVMNRSHYARHKQADPGWLLGDLVLTSRFGTGGWHNAMTHLSPDNRVVKRQDGGVSISYSGHSSQVQGVGDCDLEETWSLLNNSLRLDVTVINRSSQPLELGDVGVPLPFYTLYEGQTGEILSGRVMKHSFMSGHGSYAFWMRLDGSGPYLLLTTPGETRFEYFHIEGRAGAWEGNYVAYAYSGVKGPATAGTWRQNHTTRILPPGEKWSMSLKFQWQPDYASIREALYQEGEIDIETVPGMVVPQDLEVQVKLRLRGTISSIEAEYPDETYVSPVPESDKDTRIYRVAFRRLGENRLIIHHDGNQATMLEFFCTEPLETLIKKRAAHLVRYQQVRDPSKWYDGLFAPWDMRRQRMRTPDDTDGFDGWWGYVIACDDPGLCHAPYVAAKNVHYPDPNEIKAVEYYIKHFVWGGLQRTDQEQPDPYAIYGVPNWYEHRVVHVNPEKVWRVFDYPHIVTLYYHMYEIARKYPDMVNYLDRQGYLERAWQTAMAYYRRGGWVHDVATYNELVFVDVIAALRQEGRGKDADTLEAEWKKKVINFVKNANYGSEYAMDTTAFESTHAFARWARDNDLGGAVSASQIDNFMEKQMQGNLAVRGWLEPAWYFYGSDYRASGSSGYTLSYMAQMGGWAVLDYAIRDAADPLPLLRLGYASYLSSWALMNTGTSQTNYGYWWGGLANDGAIGWAFEPRKNTKIWLQSRYQERGVWPYDGEIDLGLLGALRMARAIVADDPVFGLLGYGCEVKHVGDVFEVTVKDGLRERVLLHNLELSLELDRDAFSPVVPVRVNSGKTHLSFKLDNETKAFHTVHLQVKGLPAGRYRLILDQSEQGLSDITAGQPHTFTIDLPSAVGVTVMIEKTL